MGNATAVSLGTEAALAMEATLAPDVTKVNAPLAEEGLLEVTVRWAWIHVSQKEMGFLWKLGRSPLPSKPCGTPLPKLQIHRCL